MKIYNKKVMRVVYSVECFDSELEGYMGEGYLSLGEYFDGEFMQGKVTKLHYTVDRSVTVEVDNKVAMEISPHAVQRIYYGEE